MFYDNLQSSSKVLKNSQETCYNSIPLGQELNPDLYKIN
jgi:hypothetical protein